MNNMDAQVATLLVTALLAIITAYYAWQTREMVKEMVEGRNLGSMPILSCTIELDTKPSYEHKNEWDGEYSLKISNVGNAPALETYAYLELSNPDTAEWRIPVQAWHVNTIQASSEKALDVELATDHEITKPPSGDKVPKVRVKITYRNVYNVKYQAVSDFETIDTRMSLKAHLHPWSQTYETTSILGLEAQAAISTRNRILR
jgi:hypothetical protein